MASLFSQQGGRMHTSAWEKQIAFKAHPNESGSRFKVQDYIGQNLSVLTLGK